jgi:hypothetical protein
MPRLQQRIDRVLQFNGSVGLVREVLDVVQQEQIEIAILPAETGKPGAVQRFEKLIQKLFGGEIDEPASGSHLFGVRPDRLQQMRFSGTGRPVQHQ